MVCYYIENENFEVDMQGIEREIDSLGRVVIPVEYRRSLGVKANSRVILTISGDTVHISAANRCCALCGARIDEREVRLCDECVGMVKAIK